MSNEKWIGICKSKQKSITSQYTKGDKLHSIPDFKPERTESSLSVSEDYRILNPEFVLTGLAYRQLYRRPNPLLIRCRTFHSFEFRQRQIFLVFAPSLLTRILFYFQSLPFISPPFSPKSGDLSTSTWWKYGWTILERRSFSSGLVRHETSLANSN